MKNLKKEDIYDWVKNYLPSYLKNPNYDLDTLIKLYQKGKDVLGKFKIGDYVAYDWRYPSLEMDSNNYHTAVAIFECYNRNDLGDVCTTIPESPCDGEFIFKTLVLDSNIFDIDDMDSISTGSYVVYAGDMRLASEDEKKFFFEKIKKRIYNDNFKKF